MKITSCSEIQPATHRVTSNRAKFCAGIEPLGSKSPNEKKPVCHPGISRPGQTAPFYKPGEVSEGGGIQSVQEIPRESSLEELAQAIMSAVKGVPTPVDRHQLVMTFRSGWLPEVTCVVDVRGKIVRCRLKSGSALGREYLRQGEKSVAIKLASAGLSLAGYEVLP